METTITYVDEEPPGRAAFIGPCLNVVVSCGDLLQRRVGWSNMSMNLARTRSVSVHRGTHERFDWAFEPDGGGLKIVLVMPDAHLSAPHLEMTCDPSETGRGRWRARRVWVG